MVRSATESGKPPRWAGVDLIGVDFREFEQNRVNEWRKRAFYYQKELEMSNNKVDRVLEIHLVPQFAQKAIYGARRHLIGNKVSLLWKWLPAFEARTSEE
jgi:hypothetical protein